MSNTITSTNSHKIYGLDRRSIGLFRILLGLNIILNIIQYRLFNIHDFYSPQAILPIDFIETFYGNNFSLLFYIQNETAVLLYFLLTLFLAVGYTLGVKSRWISIPLLLLFSGIVNRNPMASHGVEFLIEISLFWGLFLPLDSNFSIAPDKRKYPTEIRGIKVWAILFQIGLMYFTSFITKNGDFWTSGLTIYSLTADLTHANFLSSFLSSAPGLCKFLTYFALMIEGLLPFLIFIPFISKKARLISALLIIGLHFGLASTIYVGPFHFITLCFAVLMLPDFVWNRFNVSEDKNFGHLKIGQRYFTQTLPDSILPIAKKAVSIFLVLMLLLIFQRNFSKWGKQSFFASGIKNSPGLHRIASSTPMNATFITGLFRQPWWLFAPNPHSDMGTIVMLGRTPQNEVLDIINNQILTVSNDPKFNVPIFDKSIQNNFRNARFTLSFYTRKLLDNAPEELYKRWTESEYERWLKAHPDRPLLELSTYYYAIPTSINNGELVREKGFLTLYRMEIQAGGE